MIYQKNNEFLLTPFTASYEDKEVLVLDKERFERDLLTELKYEEYEKLKVDGDDNNRFLNIEDIVVELPTITYTTNTLTVEQNLRLTEINSLGIKTFTLDEVNNYVCDNVLPINDGYNILKLQDDSFLLGFNLAEEKLKNIENQQTIDLLGQELAEIKIQLLLQS